jgi:hypothetical protein
MIILAQLDPIMENKLAANAALLLKWINVRRIERRWTGNEYAAHPIGMMTDAQFVA